MDASRLLISRLRRPSEQVARGGEAARFRTIEEVARALRNFAAERLKRSRQAGLVTFVRDLVSSAK